MWWPSITASTQRLFSGMKRPWRRTIRQKLELGSGRAAPALRQPLQLLPELRDSAAGAPRLRERLGGRKLKLFLTCRLRSEDNPGSYRAAGGCGPGRTTRDRETSWWSWVRSRILCCITSIASAACTLRRPTRNHLRIRWWRQWRAGCRSWPPIRRCIAKFARMPRFTSRVFPRRHWPHEFARSRIPPSCRRQLSDRGQERSRAFSWHKHVDELLNLAANLLATIDPVRRRK